MNIVYKTLIIFRNSLRYVIDILITDTETEIINKFAQLNIVITNPQATIILANKTQPDSNANCCNV